MEIDSILNLVRPGLERVQAELVAGVKVKYPIVASVLESLISAGGKRLRPGLVFLAAKFGDYDLENLTPIAASVEMLHTATLIHDDTIDHALLRRGNRTLNSILDPNTTILMGDYLFAQSAVLIAKPGIPRVTSILGNTLADICDGELMQAFTAHTWNTDRENYVKRIYSKTAVLFAAAAEMGAVASKQVEEQITALKEYGRYLGMAFQIMDDVLDFSSTSSELGKPVGNDLKQGIVTLPVIWFAENHSENREAIEHLRRVIEYGTDEDAQRAVEVIAVSGALEASVSEAEQYVADAKSCISILPDTEYRRGLFALADYAVSRSL